jgi:asparagine N-glycosylation enzyme membrane subunit Stt3
MALSWKHYAGLLGVVLVALVIYTVAMNYNTKRLKAAADKKK